MISTNVRQHESQHRAKLDSIQMNSSKTVAPKRLSIIDRGKSWVLIIGSNKVGQEIRFIFIPIFDFRGYGMKIEVRDVYYQRDF